MALILENVGKTFENTGQATLKNINLEIQPGEFLCVVGKSGCGKSTLLNLIAGLEAPTEGRILLNGKEVKGPGSERTVMFQEHALFPWNENKWSSEGRTGNTGRKIFEDDAVRTI